MVIIFIGGVMGWLMTGAGGDAITLLEVIDPYEITMVVV